MARTGRRRRESPAFRDVNIMPLVDVMMVLLILFMITAPLLMTGLPVDLPNVSAEPAPVHDSRLVVSVTADGRVFLNERDVTTRVAAALREDPALAKAHAVYIRADENVRYGIVAAVVAAARAAEVQAVNLIVEREGA